MKFQVIKGETSVILTVFIQDSSATTGAGLGSLDQTSSITGGYVKRDGTGVALAVDENVTTEGTYAAPSTAAQVRIGTPANMTTGVYELHFHNDLFTTADWVTITLDGATNMAPLTLEIQLVDQPINDATMWGGIQRMYDGVSGNTDPTAPSSRSQVDAIGAASGGSVHIQATFDNTTTDTIDNAAAVDKGGGLVGIPVTGHAFSAGLEVTIAGSTNYNGSFEIISQTANEVVITASFVSETFTGSETIISTIKTISFVGSVQSGTFASTEAEDGVLHDIDDVGNDIDIVYGFNVGGGRTATEVRFTGFVQGNADEIKIKAFDHVGSDWEIIGTISGQNGTSNISLDRALLLKHTGIGSDLGDVYIRFETDSTTPSNFSADQLIVSAVSIGQTVGYQFGAVWINTVDGVAGTEAFVNGVADNPTNGLVDAITIATVLNFHRFVISPGSLITFAEAHANEVWNGRDWTLALESQDITGIFVSGADVSGVSTATGTYQFEACDLNAVTMDNDGHFERCSLGGIFTIGQAGTFTFHNCFTESATETTIDFAGLGGSPVHLFQFDGEINFKNMAAGDIVHITGNGTITTTTCTGGTINHDGFFEYTDAVGNVAEQQSDIKVGVDDIQTRIPSALVSGRIDSNASAIDDSNTAAIRLKQMFAATQIVTVDDATFTPTEAVFETEDTVDDPQDYANQVLFAVTAGANAGVTVKITGYAFTNSKVKLTVSQLESAPVDGDTFIRMGRIG